MSNVFSGRELTFFKCLLCCRHQLNYFIEVISLIWAVVLEKMLESPLDCKEIKPVDPKGNQSWIFIGRTDAEAETPNTLATWCEELTLWKRPWCWERLKAGGKGEGRGWDGWMASLPCLWTWVWASSGCWWWTGRPGVLQSWSCKELDMTEWLNWTVMINSCNPVISKCYFLQVIHEEAKTK